MLSQRDRLVLDTLLPSQAHPALPLGLHDVDSDAFWADFERTTLPGMRWAFRAALFAATWVSPLLIGRLPPLTRHDRPTRERALAALGASRFPFWRQMLTVLKTIVSLCYGADPEVRRAVGYWARREDGRRLKDEG